MMLIGVEPHKATHTAVAVDDREQPVARLLVASDRHQVPRLLAWADTFDAERLWAVESANGLGRLLSQPLVAAGEQVVDVPATSDRHRDLGALRTRRCAASTSCSGS